MTQGPKLSSNKPPFLAFVSDDADMATLKKFAAAHQWAESGVQQGDIRQAAQFLKNNPSPTLLAVEIPSAAEAPALLDALADVCDPDTKVITIGSVNEYSFYCWLMDLGIFSYLLKPLTLPVLETAYLKSVEPQGQKAAQDKAPGKVIAVMGTRGGVGTSTVSLNLAAIFASASAQPVTLVDVDPQAGSIALTLDIEPSRGLREALERPDRIDTLFMERVMTKPVKNLSVLSAEESLQETITIHPEAAGTLIKELRAKFAVTVLDIPRVLSGYSKECLAAADQLVLVTELTLLSLRDALRLSDLLREALKVKPPIIVANRVGLAASYEMQREDYEKGINGKIFTNISFLPELFMQTGTDIPALKHKSHAAMKPFYSLAEHLAPEIKAKSGAGAKGGFNLPVKLFKKK